MENLTQQVSIPKKKFRYIESFDSIRGFAVLLVMINHAFNTFFIGGWIGVDLFFVLSGYLITSLLQDEYSISGRISISKFYARRALRLFPPLIIFLLLANILWSFSVLPRGANQIVATLAALFYCTNLILYHVSGNMNHLWSLSVEEHFYLFWPLALRFVFFKALFRNNVKYLIMLILVTAILRLFINSFQNDLVNGLFTIDFYRFTFCRMDCILLGALLSVILYKPAFSDISMENMPNTLLITILLCAFILTLFTVSITNHYLLRGGFMITNLLCTFTVLIAIKNPSHYIFSNKILRWVGKRSYGIYLYHLPIFMALEGFRHPHSYGNLFLLTLLRFILTFAFAALSYKYAEQPILQYKKRYEMTKLITPL